MKDKLLPTYAEVKAKRQEAEAIDKLVSALLDAQNRCVMLECVTGDNAVADAFGYPLSRLVSEAKKRQKHAHNVLHDMEESEWREEAI